MGCASSVWSDEYACIRRNRVRRAKPDKRAWAVLSKDRSRGVVRPAAEGEDTAPGGDDAAGGACLLTGPIRSVGGYEMKDRQRCQSEAEARLSSGSAIAVPAITISLKGSLLAARQHRREEPTSDMQTGDSEAGAARAGWHERTSSSGCPAAVQLSF